MKTLVLKLLTLSMLLTALVVSAQDKSKIIAKKWKMVATEENGQEAKPKHKQLVIEFKKNKTFTITAAYEETHDGTWELIENGTKLVLDDKTSNEKRTLTVLELDETHLGLADYDGPGINIFLTPKTKKNAKHLSHKEYVLAKKWYIYKSESENNIGTMFEFKTDKTFIMMTRGGKVPIAWGDWKMCEDGKTLELSMMQKGEKMMLEIVELHRHEVALKNAESGIVNYFHDPKLAVKDGLLSKE